MVSFCGLLCGPISSRKRVQDAGELEMSVKRTALGQRKSPNRDRGSECSTSGRNLTSSFLGTQLSRAMHCKRWQRQLMVIRHDKTRRQSQRITYPIEVTVANPAVARTPYKLRVQEVLFSRVTGLLQENEFPCKEWQAYDKAFACAWLNSQQVVVGTKCNKLLLLNADRFCSPQIPLLQHVSLPAAPERPREPAAQPAMPGAVQTALWSIRAQLTDHSRGSTAGSALEDNDTVAGMIARAMAALDSHNAAPQAGRYGVGNGGVQTANCGIHSISLSPHGTMLACGGAEPSDCQIFRVDEGEGGAVSLKASQTLVGHKDWLFGSAWITDRHIVTGSRDTCLKLWSVDPESRAANRTPLHTQAEKNGKVRDVKFLTEQQQVASLAVDGTVQIWDAHLDSVSSAKIPYDREVVCMAASAYLAVGSQNHISLIDPRQKSVASAIANADHNHGVRSLAFAHHLLSVGGGQGRVHFFDMRAGKYLEADRGQQKGNRFLQTGAGHLARNQVYLDHFEGMEVRNACYAHAWDPTSTRLLTVGGPLAFGLTGCYMGIWE